MMQVFRRFSGLALLIGATGAFAAEVPPVPAPTTVVVPPVVAVAPPASFPVKVVAADGYKSQIVCHSSIETGSLVRTKKVCLTRKQWSYVNDINHDQAQQLLDDNRTKGSSN